MAELRTYTFALNFDGSQGITGIKNVTVALTDAKAAEEKLNAEFGESVKVTAKNITTKEEYARQARLLISQMETVQKRINDVNSQYELQTQILGKDKNAVEQLIAANRLGASATQEQRQQVMSMVAAYQAQRDEVNKSQGSWRQFRGVLQNVGWQLQDTVVQLQMGTSAFVVLSQQGSQFAAAFGPGGAIVGAFIALAGVALGTLVPALKTSSNEIDNLLQKVNQATAAQKELAKIEVQKKIDATTESLKSFDAQTNSMGSGWSRKIFFGKDASLQLQAAIDALNQDLTKYQGQLDQLNGKTSKEFKQTVTDMTDGLNQQIMSLQKGERAAALYNAAIEIRKKGAEQGISTAEINKEIAAVSELINKQYDLSDAKKAAKAANKADNSEFKAMESQVKSMSLSMEKQTNDIDTEYSRRKQIIQQYEASNRSDSSITAQAYINLEKWKTDELSKEYDKREAVRKQIEAAQNTQFGKSDPTGQENELFAENNRKLNAQMLANNLSLQEEMRIDALKEKEAKRHSSRLQSISDAQTKSSLENYNMFLGGLNNVFGSLQSAVADGSKQAEVLFYVQRAVAVATALINSYLAYTNVLASPETKTSTIFGMSLANVVLGSGIAAAGIIAGTTFAGAYDAGGYIPSGSSGIVSEYADELVNGTLVQGPAHVTSSDKTAQKMGTTLNVQVANQIDGATYDVQQIDEETVKIIARRELSKNIDKSVASVMSNPNSRTRKATSSSYSLKRKF